MQERVIKNATEKRVSAKHIKKYDVIIIRESGSSEYTVKIYHLSIYKV